MNSLFTSSESKFFETAEAKCSLRKLETLSHKDAVKVSKTFDETLTVIVKELLYSNWGEDAPVIDACIGRICIKLFVEKHIGRLNPLALCVSEGNASHSCWLITAKYRPNLWGAITNSTEVRDYFMTKINCSSVEEMKEVVSNLK